MLSLLAAIFALLVAGAVFNFVFAFAYMGDSLIDSDDEVLDMLENAAICILFASIILPFIA